MAGASAAAAERETLEARPGGSGSGRLGLRGPPADTTGRTGLTAEALVSGSAGDHEAAKVASSLGLQGPAAPIGAQLLQASGAAQASGPGPDAGEHASPTVYHANLLAGSSGNVQAALHQQSEQAALLSSLSGPAAAAALASMQASAEASSLDLQAMQSMELLFKKERIYLLAQFWQQVSPSASGNPAPDRCAGRRRRRTLRGARSGTRRRPGEGTRATCSRRASSPWRTAPARVDSREAATFADCQ